MVLRQTNATSVTFLSSQHPQGMNSRASCTILEQQRPGDSERIW